MRNVPGVVANLTLHSSIVTSLWGNCSIGPGTSMRNVPGAVANLNQEPTFLS